MPATPALVFMVESDQAMRHSFRFSLELDGFEVRTCGTVAELLAHPDLGTACCAVVDGNTLAHDKPDAIAALEGHRARPPLVLIADHIGRRRFARAIASGLFHVVETPVLDDALVRCIKALRRF
jgi:DNA-binding NtrC family response regulator